MSAPALSDDVALSIAAVNALAMPLGQALPRQQHQLMLICIAAANAGVAMPGNAELARRFGLNSGSNISHYLDLLAAKGLIRVERFHRSRRVTIVATGRSTRVDPADAIERQPCFGRAAGQPDDSRLPPRVDRDPCFRCGVRRDVGCRHHPRENARA